VSFSNAMLKELDFTIYSIHSHFGRNKQQQTERSPPHLLARQAEGSCFFEKLL
jgi:hypothetical protein